MGEGKRQKVCRYTGMQGRKNLTQKDKTYCELRIQNLELRNQRCKPRKTWINTAFLMLKTQEVQETQGGEKRSKGKKQRQS